MIAPMEIKGVTLDVTDMIKIKSHYEYECTKEYIEENYPNLDAGTVHKTAVKARELMDEDGYSEDDAIAEILKNL